jgi:hypothetical protein
MRTLCSRRVFFSIIEKLKLIAKDWKLGISFLLSITLLLFAALPVCADSTLVGYWKLDGNAIDFSEYGNNGTVYGAIAASDRFGNPDSAMTFNGIDNYISIPDNSTLKPAQITISAWIKLNINTTTENMDIVRKFYGPTGGYYLRLIHYIGTAPRISFFAAGTSDALDAEIPTGIWKHIAATYDGTYQKIYIDGALIESVSGMGLSMTNVTNPLTISAGIDAGGITNFFDGQIDDVRIYNHALSNNEIEQLYLGAAILLPKTGQTTIYAAGDDGAIRAGVAWPNLRFTDNGEQTMTDNLTGLIWTKDAGTLPVGSCTGGRKTWQSGLDYVTCLNSNSYLGHNDWRLPNYNELRSLAHLGYDEESCGGAPCGGISSWLNSIGFSHVFMSPYWSSTTTAINTYAAWGVDMYWGDAQNYPKTDTYFIWPVRGGQHDSFDSIYPANIWKTGQTLSYAAGDDGDLRWGVTWPSPRFHDNDNGTATDKLTGLIWLKNANCFGLRSWDQALSDSNSLSSGTCGLSDGSNAGDWRLPNRQEIESLIDFSGYDPALPTGHPFSGLASSQYWSSTTVYDETSAWWVNMGIGSHVYGALKTGSLYVWPVRSGTVMATSDTTPPTDFTLKSPSDGATVNKPYPYFSWNASSDNESGLAKYQLYIDGQLLRDNIVNWTAAVPTTALSNGSHAWFIRAWDNAGNYRDSATRSLEINQGNGKISFESNRDNNWEIYIMDNTGSNQTRLTNDPADDDYPALSPDGSKIALASRRDDSNHEIYIINSDGSNIMRITTDSSEDNQPDWSPDGTKICFWRDGEIYIMNSDGTDMTRLTTNNVNWMPKFSPDGSKIVFVSLRDGNGEIYVMNTDGSNQTNLTNNPGDEFFPDWSPDGSKIIFSSNRAGGTDVYIMNSDGTEQTRLTNNLYCSDPCFSPDGQKIAYEQGYPGDRDSINIMNSDGSNPISITNTDNLWRDLHPSWSVSATLPGDSFPPTTTASPAGGTYPSAQSVTLTCNDGSGSGCQTRYYCLGSGCNPTTVYTGAINIGSSTVLRFYSTDIAGNSEANVSIKAETYTITTPPSTHNITASAGENGSITPSGAVTVNHNATKSFTVTRDNGYIAVMSGTCGGNLNGSTYKTNLITEDCTVIASFNPTGPSQDLTPGNNVQVSVPVSLPSGGTGTAIIEFDQIVTGGTLNVTATGTPLGGGPPTGFKFLGTYYDVTFTGSFSGYIYITFPYNGSSIPSGKEKNLKLFHWKNNGWEDCTVLPIDTANNRITGRVTSLSPFGFGYPFSSGTGSGSSAYKTGANENMIALIAILAILSGALILRRHRRFRKS